jgi:phosphatidylinositol alpha-1,6-mannosyltransferase
MSTRILALVTDCFGAGGGIARYNQDLVEALAAKDMSIVILPRHGHAGDHVLPAGVVQLPPVAGRIAYSLAALRIILTRRPIDIVFCGHPFMAPMAWLVARLAGARYWLQAHGTDVWSGRRAIVRWSIERADMVTVVSRATRHSLLGWTRILPERVRVLPDTVRDIFTTGTPSPGLAGRLALGPGPVLLTVGRLAASERYKGHEQVFAALPALRQKYPNLVHVVAGDGDDRARLEQRAAELSGDPAAVRFLGFVPEAELPDLYRLADVYVMPSSQEGFGIVYLEAAACGVPVVGGAGGGSGDAVASEEIGLLIDPSDRSALVDAVTRLLARGRVPPEAVEPYRRQHFAATARLLLARLMARPWRMSGGS